MSRPRELQGKPPSYQWYPGDFKRDVALLACGFEARWLWRAMLDLMDDGEPRGHLTAGGVPIDATQLARIECAPVAKVRRWLKELEERKVFSRTDDGVIFSRRMVKDEKLRRVRAAAGIESLKNPNVPRPKAKCAGNDGGVEGYPSGGPSGGHSDDPQPPSFGESIEGSPAVAVAVASAVPTTTTGLRGDHLTAFVREHPETERLIASIEAEHGSAALEQALVDLGASGRTFTPARLRNFAETSAKQLREQVQRRQRSDLAETDGRSERVTTAKPPRREFRQKADEWLTWVMRCDLLVCSREIADQRINIAIANGWVTRDACEMNYRLLTDTRLNKHMLQNNTTFHAQKVQHIESIMALRAAEAQSQPDTAHA